MKTEIWKLDPRRPDPVLMARAGGVIRRGGLVAFPTETVYGLGGDALNPGAAGKIYAAKGRPSDNPLIVHISEMSMLGAIAEEVPEKALQLAEAFWPGPLTMIFRKTPLVPEATSGGLPTVAVRMPAHETALALIREGGGYIAAPSANVSGRPSPTTAAHVIEDLSGRIDLILDGGHTEIGLESTIVDFTEETPVILRPGYIHMEMLRGILGEVKTDPGLLAREGEDAPRPKAPGMRYRHYAPRGNLTIVEGETGAVVKTIQKCTSDAVARGIRVGILASEETADLYTCGRVYHMGSRSAGVSVAQHLFEVLRLCDEDGMKLIYSESFRIPGIGDAIMNRLMKAAGCQVLHAG